MGNSRVQVPINPVGMSNGGDIHDILRCAVDVVAMESYVGRWELR